MARSPQDEAREQRIEMEIIGSTKVTSCKPGMVQAETRGMGVSYGRKTPSLSLPFLQKWPKSSDD